MQRLFFLAQESAYKGITCLIFNGVTAKSAGAKEALPIEGESNSCQVSLVGQVSSGTNLHDASRRHKVAEPATFPKALAVE